MKNVSIIVVLLLFLLIAALPVSAGNTKVSVCHVDDQGIYHLVNVSENAFTSHVDHGDATPGEAVPNLEGYTFDDDCHPVTPVCLSSHGPNNVYVINFNLGLTPSGDLYGETADFYSAGYPIPGPWPTTGSVSPANLFDTSTDTTLNFVASNPSPDTNNYISSVTVVDAHRVVGTNNFIGTSSGFGWFGAFTAGVCAPYVP